MVVVVVVVMVVVVTVAVAVAVAVVVVGLPLHKKQKGCPRPQSTACMGACTRGRVGWSSNLGENPGKCVFV